MVCDFKQTKGVNEMSSMKKLLALAAIFICGGAWAATGDVLVKWDGDLANGSTKTNDGATYTMSSRSDDSDDVSYANGVARTLQKGARDSRGVMITLPSDSAKKVISVLVRYSGYDRPNAWSSLVSAGYMDGNTDKELMFVNPNSDTQVNVKYGTTTAGQTANGTAKDQTVYANGYLLATFDATNKKAKIAIADINGNFQNPVEFADDTASYWPTAGYTNIKIGGTIAGSGNTHRSIMGILGVAIYEGDVCDSRADLVSALNKYAYFSVGFDGDAFNESAKFPDGKAHANTLIGEMPGSSPTYEAVRGSDTDKAIKIVGTAGTNSDIRPGYSNASTFYGAVVANASWTVQLVAKAKAVTDKSIALWCCGGATWRSQNGVALLANTEGKLSFIKYVSKSGTEIVTCTNASIYDDLFHSITVVCDKDNETSKYKVYLDGVLVGSSESSVTLAEIGNASGQSSFQLGTLYGGPGEISNMSIAIANETLVDTAVAWACALTDDEVAAAAAKFKIWPWPGEETDLLWTKTEAVTIDSESTALNIFGRQIVINGADKLIFNANATISIADDVSVGALEVKGGTLSVQKGTTSSVFNGERIIVSQGGTLYIDYYTAANAPVFRSGTETTIVLNGGSVTSYGWPTVEGTVNFETLVDTTIWSAILCSNGKLIKSGSATLTLGTLLTNRPDDEHPHDVEITAGTLKLNNAANTVRNLTIAAGASLDFNGSSGSLMITGKLTVNSAESFTIPSNFTLDTAATVSIASGTLKSTRNDLAIVDVPEGKVVDISDADESGYYTYSIATPVASITVNEVTTKYASVSAASAAALAAGATAENPIEVVTLTSIASAVKIPDYIVVFATFANRITGALSGSGTYKMINTADMTSSTNWDKTIDSWFGAGALSSFNGTLWMARGRFKTSATVEEGRVRFKITDGAQLFVTGGSVSNPIEISGNGIPSSFESNAIIYAALRLDSNVTYSGNITAVATGDEPNEVLPMVGIHNTASPTVSGAIICPDGVRLHATFASDVLSLTGAIKGSATDDYAAGSITKIGAGKVVFGTGATATNVALKLSAGNIEKTASMAFISATTDVTGKLVFSSNTEYKLITGTLMANTTELWGADDNSTYLSRSADSPTALFASDISLAKIASGEYKFTGKMKGAWITTARDVKVVKRDDYVDGSNKLELQCQMYDGEHTNDKNDWYTKCQNLTLMQIEVNGVYYLFAQAYKGFYVDDHIDHCGDVITTSTTNYHTVTSENAYEAIKLELAIGDVVAKIGNRTFMTLEAAIAAANAMQGDAEIVMQGSAESPLESTDSVTLNSNVILKMTPYAKTIGTISGSGVVVFDGFLPGNAQRNVFVTDAWTGTVVIEHVTANTTYGNFGTCCNANSSLALDGVSCYFYTNGTAANPDVVCKNLTIGDDGIKLQGRFSTGITKYTFKKLQGSGTITVEADNDGGANKHGYLCLIGDVSEFDGKIAFGTGNNKHEVVIAADADDLPPLDAANYTAGTIYYASGAARPDIIADGTTLTVAPGGDLTVPADFNVANVTVKYAGTVLNNESGPIAVDIVNNKLVYSIKPEMENTVRPTVTTMAAPTIESQDRISFTISSPIPGLFYSVVSASGPTDSDFESGTDSIGTQATGRDSHTTSIDMPTDAKVKYFRVRVKATK